MSSDRRRRRRVGGSSSGLEYDLPLDYVWNVRTDLPAIFGTPDFLWVAGDGNSPTYGPTLTATGSPSSGEPTPWVDGDGDAVTAEGTTPSAFRTTASAVDPAADEDVVVAALIDLRVAVNGKIFLGNRSGGHGWIVYFVSPNQLRFYVSGDTAAAAVMGTATKGWALSVAVIDRDGTIVTYFNGIAGGTVACPAGSLVGAGLGIGAGAEGAGNGLYTRFAWGAVWHGVGIADAWLADSASEVKRLSAMGMGTFPQHGDGLGLSPHTRAGAASWQDSNDLWHIVSTGMPRSGGDSPLFEPARTNKCYNNIDPSATTGNGSTGGTLTTTDDSAALSTADLGAWGPNVLSFSPGGSDEVFYSGAASGGTDAHCWSVFLRGGSGGEQVHMGHADADGSNFEDLTALTLTDTWVRYTLANTAPDAADQHFALDCDAGDDIYIIGHDWQEGETLTSPIPNVATAAAATRAADLIETAWTPVDSLGSVECDVAPVGWDDTEAGDATILDRATGAGELLRADAAGGLATDDGTTEVRDTTTALADGGWVSARVGWGPSHQRLTVEGTMTSDAYDGALQGSGVVTVEPGAAVRVRHLRCYRT